MNDDRGLVFATVALIGAMGAVASRNLIVIVMVGGGLLFTGAVMLCAGRVSIPSPRPAVRAMAYWVIEHRKPAAPPPPPPPPPPVPVLTGRVVKALPPMAREETRA